MFKKLFRHQRIEQSAIFKPSVQYISYNDGIYHLTVVNAQVQTITCGSRSFEYFDAFRRVEQINFI